MSESSRVIPSILSLDDAKVEDAVLIIWNVPASNAEKPIKPKAINHYLGNRFIKYELNKELNLFNAQIPISFCSTIMLCHLNEIHQQISVIIWKFRITLIIETRNDYQEMSEKWKERSFWNFKNLWKFCYWNFLQSLFIHLLTNIYSHLRICLQQ